MSKSGFMIHFIRNKDNKAINELKCILSQYSLDQNSVYESEFNFSKLLNVNKQPIIKLLKSYTCKMLVSCDKIDNELLNHIYNSTFQSIQKVIPLELVIVYKLSIIKSFLKTKTKLINENDTFKIECKLLKCNKVSRKEELFELIFSLFNNKVNLTTPDFVITIQSIENVIGVSLIDKNNKLI
ncbi:hypothetical protein A0H76_958 [Hepatospora eriocheir]|uniref:THUMP domain-containing protein n=1 Tax=Hepatospora eriocheir TaxID=1081669 RepID=A0A1X0QHX9_9MICR|nr:hypothetical protein HERIO_988 [Hepatospora eriocheir]ORD99373.1 hypothetical protein A0H76_958 [Hepatospora eriocheir]